VREPEELSVAVGLVVVSHSRALGEAAAELAREMVPGDAVRIEVAAGLTLPDGGGYTLGTDATAIAEALTRADSGAGVVVLMDLGSAVLSAEMALEFHDDPDSVLLCPAPLVEGLVAAAVAAAGGADRAAIAAEAAEGTAAKRAQLGGESGGESVADRGSARPDRVGRFVVTPPHGLHARPAALLVRTVAGFEARVELVDLTNGRGPVDAASLTRVAALGAATGDEIEVRASGPQSTDALQALLDLAAGSFGEPQPGPVRSGPTSDRDPRPGSEAVGDRPAAFPTVDHGPVAGAPGIAIGPVRVLREAALVVPDDPADDPPAERARLARGIVAARAAITATRDAAPAAEAAIFDAHLEMLGDPALVDATQASIDAGRSAAAGWGAAVDAAEAELAALPGEYLRARAADVRAVGDEVLRALLAGRADDPPAPAHSLPSGSGAAATSAARTDAAQDTTPGPGAGGPGEVVLARDLTPAQAATLEAAGVVLAGGSPTAHAVIILRARGIPAVLGAGEEVLGTPDGTTVVLDGGTGELRVDPPDADRYIARRARAQARERAAQERLHEPAVTPDGTRVLVGVNLGAEFDPAPDPAPGADLAGLVRTEFLFLDRDRAPSVDEQEAAYRAVAGAMGDRRIVLRTLDVGGDKPLPYLPQEPEANPFLGVRGLRLALRRPDLLDEQLRAIVRVARDHPVSVMFPMVTVPAELDAARAALARAQDREGPADLEVGIMIEVPAAALTAREFDVDFFSVGTNDLTQYTLAAERGNPQLSALADPLHPAVLHLVEQVCDTGVPTAVCGELAADPRATGLLVGLGVRELSVAPPAVARVKQAVRESRGLPADLWTTRGAEAVRALLPEG
jgi:multiphosphoryl transfer protein